MEEPLRPPIECVILRRSDSNFELFPQSVRMVFELPELREMIITRAIFQPRKNPGCSRSINYVICPKNVKSLRLVSKEWLVSVSKVLQNQKISLFTLVLDKNNSLSQTPYVVQENGKLLDNFVTKTYSSPLHLECAPTFSLKIMEEFFHPDNHTSLQNCLVKIGENLLTLEMNVPQNGGNLPFIFPPFLLASLQTLTLNYSGNKYSGTLENSTNFSCTANLVNILSSLLNASINLKHFSILKHGVMPSSFQFVTLPETLSALKLYCKMSSKELQILAKSKLPNLDRLSLHVPAVPFENGLIFKILNNLCETLRVLKLVGITRWSTDHLTPTLVWFPFMKKLEVLQFTGTNLLLEKDTLYLAMWFPKLIQLVLWQNQIGFRKWTEPSVHYRLSALDVRLYDDSVRGDNVDPTMAISLENMELVDRAFHNNLSYLTLRISGKETAGIRYVFKEMKQLTILKLEILGSEVVPNSNFWDALLVGTTEEQVLGLKAYPDLWKIVNLEKGNLPSIRMLTELRTLKLEANCNSSMPFEPLISDLSFIRALLIMPNLTELHFQGRFKASDKMREEWIKKNGVMYYSSS